jgi:hypothetical protein
MNISHFLSWWIYFEPVIFQLLPPHRRVAIQNMANMFTGPPLKDKNAIMGLADDYISNYPGEFHNLDYVRAIFRPLPVKHYTKNRMFTLPPGFYVWHVENEYPTIVTVGAHGTIYISKRPMINSIYPREDWINYIKSFDDREIFLIEALGLPRTDPDAMSRYNKYTAVHVHHNRMEVRIIQGTMDINIVFGFLYICMLFLARTILVSTKPPFGRVQPSKRIQHLLEWIEDLQVQRFIIDQYQRYKQDGWPDVPPGIVGSPILPYPWQTWSPAQHNIVRSRQNANCDINMIGDICASELYRKMLIRNGEQNTDILQQISPASIRDILLTDLRVLLVDFPWLVKKPTLTLFVVRNVVDNFLRSKVESRYNMTWEQLMQVLTGRNIIPLLKQELKPFR